MKPIKPVLPPDLTKDKLMVLRTKFYEECYRSVLQRREAVYYLYERAFHLRQMIGKPIPQILLDKNIEANQIGIPSIQRYMKQDVIRLKNHMEDFVLPEPQK